MPKVKDIRGFSDFGYSYIYIIFDEGTDIYWARSRTLEYLNSVTSRLPKGVNVELAKDATAVGWVYQYALVDTAASTAWSRCARYQDWYLRYALQSLPGVAEVAPVGGFVRAVPGQHRSEPTAGLQDSDQRRGRRDPEIQQRCRRHGWSNSAAASTWCADAATCARSTTSATSCCSAKPQSGTPVRVRDVATVTFGPDMRRGVGELDGKGEAVGGVVIMRVGENAEKVIERVKAQISDMQPTLPPGLAASCPSTTAPS